MKIENVFIVKPKQAKFRVVEGGREALEREWFTIVMKTQLTGGSAKDQKRLRELERQLRHAANTTVWRAGDGEVGGSS